MNGPFDGNGPFDSNDLFDRILRAHTAIRPDVPVTALERSTLLSALTGAEVLLKTEHLQPTGSFKIRGATYKIRSLGDAAAAGVVTASTGNHGQAVARAGRLAGVGVEVFVGAATTPSKREAIEALGARVHVIDGSPLDAELQARAHAADSGRPYVAPYNDLDTMAGQGTLGLELHEQAPGLDAVFICVGGGGLIGGAGTALKQLSPATRVVGVWPAAATNMLDSLKAGRIVETPESETLSDGSTGAVEEGSVSFPVCQEVIDETVTVSEPEIAEALRLVAQGDRWIVEGAAAVAVAGLLKTAEQYRGKTVAVVLCGRNIALDRFLGGIRNL